MWQLEDDLIKLNPEWEAKPKAYKNQVYSQKLQVKYQELTAVSKVQETP
jgi:hypothetical protein